MASPEKLKKYQKEKFEHYKKINNLKINDNEAYISLKVSDYKSIISDFSLEDQPVLKAEFIEVIEKRAEIIPLDYPLVLEIHNKTFSAEQKITVRKLIKNRFTFISINKETELKRIKQKSYYFLMLGIVTFIISMLLYNVKLLIPIYEILYFIASFSIWEFGELVIFEQDDLKEEIIKYKHLSKIRVVYDKD
ncbi:MAG: hypothetical protein ACI4XM_00715 [Candidatus Coprovivens sp.]